MKRESTDAAVGTVAEIEKRMAAVLAVPKAEADALEAERPKRERAKPAPKPKHKKKGAA